MSKLVSYMFIALLVIAPTGFTISGCGTSIFDNGISNTVPKSENAALLAAYELLNTTNELLQTATLSGSLDADTAQSFLNELNGVKKDLDSLDDAVDSTQDSDTVTKATKVIQTILIRVRHRLLSSESISVS